MTKNLILFLIVLGLSSCYTENKPTIKAPDFLMSEELVVDILTDLQLAEGIITYSRLGKTSIKRDFKDSIYQVIFNHYEITAEQLNENLDYYNNDLEQMEKMYEQVLINLSKYESEIMLEEKKQDTVAIKEDTVSIKEE